MSELEWANFFEQALWFGSLLSPLVVGVATAAVVRRSSMNRLRIYYVGSLCAFAFGAAGSFALGEVLVSFLMGGAGDIPYYLIAEAWHRMWYPLGVGIFVGVALAFYALLSERKKAA